jgi:hypothetical protein
MKLEAKSVPVVWENAAHSTNRMVRQLESWTPYRIRVLKNQQVHVTPFFTTPVVNFDQKEFILPLPNQEEVVHLSREEVGQYKVGDVGMLKIFDNACTYSSNDGKIVFSAKIPTKDRTDATCTALTILGVSMKTSGLGH